MIQDKFYVIEITHHQNPNQKGFVVETETGVKVLIGGINASITQYKTTYAAQHCINRHNLNNNVTKAEIISNEQIIARASENIMTGIFKQTQTLYYIENFFGDKLCFDSKKNGYYFASRSVGYCCWEDAPAANTAITGLGLAGKAMVKPLEVKTE